MAKPSPDIFGVSSVQSCDERTVAFSHHSDARLASSPVSRAPCVPGSFFSAHAREPRGKARPAREMWTGLTCARNSVLPHVP